MKTLKLAAMLMLMFGCTVAAISQTAAPTSAPGAQPDARSFTVTIQVDVAWDPKQLPLTDDDLGAFATQHSFGGTPKGGTFERIPLPKTRATTSASSGPTVKADWQAVRFKATGVQVIGRGFQKELEFLHLRRSAGEQAVTRTERWMRRLQLLSSDTYRQLTEEVSKLELQHSDGEETAQIKEAKALIRALKLDLSAKTARREVIEKAIHVITERAAAKAAEDPILREMEKIRALREAEVKRVKAIQAAGQASQSELAQAEINLLETTVKVSQRKEAVASAVSADLLPKLASEQAMLGIDLEEMHMRVRILEDDVARLEQPAREAARKLEAAKKRLEAERCWAIIASPEPKLQDK
jgi:hypothetical protein